MLDLLPTLSSGDAVDDALSLSFENCRTPLPVLHHADELLLRSADDRPLEGRTAADTDVLMRVARWSNDFLTHSHPALGRSGHVCPYVSGSIREHQFLLTLLDCAATMQRQTEEVMCRLGRHFLQLEPRAGRLAQPTIVVLFPDLPRWQTADIINGMHRRLKPQFLRHGLMLGEFYEDSCKPGLHNPEFRPLRSEVPLLVIRSMLLADIGFLSDTKDFARAFIETFKARGCAEIRSYLDARRDSLPAAQSSMLLEQLVQYEGGVRRAERAELITRSA
jgi:hypothetical protein